MDRNTIETDLGILKYKVESTEETVKKVDSKIDGLQSFMNKLYDVFVTQKELEEVKKAFAKENAELRSQIRELQKDNRKLVVRSAFISGIGFVAVMFKDILIDTIIDIIKNKP